MLDHEEKFLFKEEILHLANAVAEPGTLDNVEDLLTDVITSPRFDSEVFTLERSLQVMLGPRAGTTLVGLLTVAPEVFDEVAEVRIPSEVHERLVAWRARFGLAIDNALNFLNNPDGIQGHNFATQVAHVEERRVLQGRLTLVRYNNEPQFFVADAAVFLGLVADIMERLGPYLESGRGRRRDAHPAPRRDRAHRAQDDRPRLAARAAVDGRGRRRGPAIAIPAGRDPRLCGGAGVLPARPAGPQGLGRATAGFTAQERSTSSRRSSSCRSPGGCWRASAGWAGDELLVFLVIAIVWVEGQAIHLATNAIGDVFSPGPARDAFYATEAGDLDHWFDEGLGHWLWHLAWAALSILMLVAGDRPPGLAAARWLAAARRGPAPGRDVLLRHRRGRDHAPRHPALACSSSRGRPARRWPARRTRCSGSSSSPRR